MTSAYSTSHWDDTRIPVNADKSATISTYVLRSIPPRPPMEAVRLTESNLESVATWADRTVMISAGVKGIRVAWPRSDYAIDAFPGDWLVRDPQGNLTLMNNALFNLTYMPTGTETEGE